MVPPRPSITPEDQATLDRAKQVRKIYTSRSVAPAPEPKPGKAHWDFLLEEMKWMANEFNQERKWKTAQCKRFATSAAKSNMDVESRDRLRQLEEAQAIKKKASWMAKQVSMHALV